MTEIKSLPKRVVPWTFAALAAVIVIANYYETKVSKKTLDEAESQKPFVFIYMTPGLSEDLKRGLIAAVWNDGQIIRTRSDADIGKKYVKGKLSTADVARIKQLILQRLPESPKVNWIVVDAAADHLAIRFTSGVWSNSHSPPHTNDPEIAQMRNELMNAAIENPSEIDGAAYKDWPSDWDK
ncbi:MAG: hypothetical protein AABZ08_11630 [Planctomycetota bacterium]